VDYRSSLHEIDFFLGSHVWDDMRDDFEYWLEGVRDDLENCNSIEEIYRCQGRAEAVRRMLKWPENLRDILEEAKK
jgi:hypothetical protein